MTALIVDFFTFTVTEKQLSILTTENVNPSLPSVNLLCLTIYQCEDPCLLNVILRVGVTDPTSSDNKTMTEQFIKNLKELCIKFKIVKGIVYYGYTQSVNTPGFYREFITLAYCNHIKIYNAFESPGSPNSETESVINAIVSDVYKAYTLLSSFDTDTADQTLCINKNNIEHIVSKESKKCHKCSKHKCSCK
jgi:hypothetical protein